MTEVPDPRYCFTYGSLMFAELMHAVAAMQPLAVGASLRGWQRRAIRSANYPAAFPAPSGTCNATVVGVLWLGLSAQAWRRLDAFEGAEYERVEVEVELGVRLEVARGLELGAGEGIEAGLGPGPARSPGEAPLQAWTGLPDPALTKWTDPVNPIATAGLQKAWIYRFRDLRRVLEHDWDPSAFRSRHLADFFREHGRDLV